MTPFRCNARLAALNQLTWLGHLNKAPAKNPHAQLGADWSRCRQLEPLIGRYISDAQQVRWGCEPADQVVAVAQVPHGARQRHRLELGVAPLALAATAHLRGPLGTLMLHRYVKTTRTLI